MNAKPLPKKAGRRLEDDALFREIGGQLAGLGGEGFDYSQWQRRQPVKSPPKSPSISKEKTLDVKSKRPDTAFTISTIAPTYASLRRLGSSGSSCTHGVRYKAKPDVPIDEDARKQRLERLKILQLRVRARRKTLAEYQNRYCVLLDENIKLKDKIDAEEGQNHRDVKKLLRKYEKFRGGIATLNDRFVVDLGRAKAELEKTKIKTSLDLKVLQDQVDEIEEKLKEKQRELNVLMNYKDKEYPLKSLRIAELGKELIDLKSQNQEEIDELQRIVDSELDKHRRVRNNIKREITVKVTSDYTKKIDPSWEDMAMQNKVMQKEIEFHKRESEELETVIAQLDTEVKAILRDPKTNVRYQLFPQFFPPAQICTPDMEVVLDIPTQRWLPI